jgi:hypothetical protein
VSDYQRNLNACLNGAYACDKSKVAQADLARVAVSDYQRNLNACLNGAYACDKSKVAQADLARV